MVFFVARRNQNRKVEVTVGDIFASGPGIDAGQAARQLGPPAGFHPFCLFLADARNIM